MEAKGIAYCISYLVVGIRSTALGCVLLMSLITISLSLFKDPRGNTHIGQYAFGERKAGIRALNASGLIGPKLWLA